MASDRAANLYLFDGLSKAEAFGPERHLDLSPGAINGNPNNFVGENLRWTGPGGDGWTATRIDDPRQAQAAVQAANSSKNGLYVVAVVNINYGRDNNIRTGQHVFAVDSRLQKLAGYNGDFLKVTASSTNDLPDNPDRAKLNQDWVVQDDSYYVRLDALQKAVLYERAQ